MREQRFLQHQMSPPIYFVFLGDIWRFLIFLSFVVCSFRNKLFSQWCQTAAISSIAIPVQLRNSALGAPLQTCARPYPMLSPKTVTAWSSSPLALTITFQVSFLTFIHVYWFNMLFYFALLFVYYDKENVIVGNLVVRSDQDFGGGELSVKGKVNLDLYIPFYISLYFYSTSSIIFSFCSL